MDTMKILIAIFGISLMIFLLMFTIKEIAKKEPIPQNIEINRLASNLSQITVDDKYICFIYSRSISCLHKEK